MTNTYLVYETTGKHPDVHVDIQASTNRDALVAFKRSGAVPTDSYISQVQTGRRYVLEAPDGSVWIADKS